MPFGLSDILILAGIGLLLWEAIRCIKKNGGGCGGNCGSCSGCSGCAHAKEKK